MIYFIYRTISFFESNFKKVKLISKFYYSFRFFGYNIVILQDTTKL